MSHTLFFKLNLNQCFWSEDSRLILQKLLPFHRSLHSTHPLSAIMDSNLQLQAEFDLIQAAYSPEEVWIDDNDDDSKVLYRRLYHHHDNSTFLLRLDLFCGSSSSSSTSSSTRSSIQVSGSVETAGTKSAYRTISALIQACQSFADNNEHRRATTTDEEEEDDLVSIFALLQMADAWLLLQDLDTSTTSPHHTDDVGGTSCAEIHQETASSDTYTTTTSGEGDNKQLPRSTAAAAVVKIARNMIYSHHIIGKQKRADMKHMAADLQLTGFIKIGWPGFMVIEGKEDDVQYFYDTIRRWQWQYLVLRGEMKDDRRLFPPLQEVTDIAIVANHCRQVGIESLFRTSMLKLQPKNAQQQSAGAIACDTVEELQHGALIHVDHMNNAKGYRKWLAKTCRQQSVALVIRQCFETRPIIIVCLFGLQEGIAAVLQQWRCCNVDHDARGRPCRERQMTVLLQGPVPRLLSETNLDKDESRELNTTREKLETLILEMTNLPSWIEAMDHLW